MSVLRRWWTLPLDETLFLVIGGVAGRGLLVVRPRASFVRSRPVSGADADWCSNIRKVDKKIAISGSGRCNFTNINTHPDNFISANPHFRTPALGHYTAADFVAVIEKHGIGDGRRWIDGRTFVADNGSRTGSGTLFHRRSG